MEKQAQQKNLVIFFPWDKKEINIFSKIKKDIPIDSIDIDLINRSRKMGENILLNMKFECSHDHSNMPVLTDYLTDDDWKELETEFKTVHNWKTAVAISVNSIVPQSHRGWIIDLKNLHFYSINDFSLNFFRNKLKVIKTFNELEKFIEEFKFRFAAKKFGI